MPVPSMETVKGMMNMCPPANNLVPLFVTVAWLAGVFHASAPSYAGFPQLTAALVSAGHVLHVQASVTKLAGTWTDKSGVQFEVTHSDEIVEMTFSGPTPTSRKGKISGNFDGAVFAGAYEATEGNTTDRGVVRFLRSPNGTLEGSWRSLVNGRQGMWSLSKK